MSSKTLLRLWQQLLDQMSKAITSGSIDPKERFHELFLQMTELPEPSPATWKALIQDMQVSNVYRAMSYIPGSYEVWVVSCSSTAS
jgi:hypothetical protein